MARHVRTVETHEASTVKLQHSVAPWAGWPVVGRTVASLLLVGLLLGSIPVAAHGSAWAKWALFVLFVDCFVFMPLLARVLRDRTGRRRVWLTLLVVAVVWLIPATWLWFAIDTLSGSRILPTVLVPILAYLTLDYAAWRWKRTAERAQASIDVKPTRRQLFPPVRGGWDKPTVKDYLVAVCSPHRWGYPTLVVAMVFVLPTFIASLYLGSWSFLPILVPVGATFLTAINSIAGHRAWKRNRPGRISVQDLAERQTTHELSS